MSVRVSAFGPGKGRRHRRQGQHKATRSVACDTDDLSVKNAPISALSRSGADGGRRWNLHISPEFFVVSAVKQCPRNPYGKASKLLYTRTIQAITVLWIYFTLQGLPCMNVPKRGVVFFFSGAEVSGRASEE